MDTMTDLLFEQRGQVAWLTLNREARRNAISAAMIDLFHESLDRIEADTGIRAVCITGAGDKAFCSGADLGMAPGSEGPAEDAARYGKLLQRLVRFPRPIVARVNGHCLAGGMGLMLAADMAYAKTSAKIGTPEVKVGLFPMMIGALIFRNAPRKKALEMIYTGELVEAPEAERMGLVTRALPDGVLDQIVEQKLAAICRNAPLAMSMGRPALAAAEEMELDAAIAHLCGRLGELMKTEDAAEGLAAFLQKREPAWKGR